MGTFSGRGGDAPQFAQCVPGESMMLRPFHARRRACALGAFLFLVAAIASAPAQSTATRADSARIPHAEHPRPDFQRAEWRNLNGVWRFSFDAANAGEAAGWFRAPLAEPRAITVPFSWGAPLSGVPDSGDVGWYERAVEVPASWRGR